MAAEAKPAGQAPTDPGTGATLTTPPAAAAAPAAGAAAESTAKPAGDGGQATPPAAATSGDKDGAAGATPKVPDKYELKVPEGAGDHIDAADLDAWATKAKAEGWSNEEAQQQLDTLAGQLVSQMKAFRAVTESDATYGKEHLEANQQLARRVVERFRPAGHARKESFERFLLKTGVGNHIEMFALLADIGRAMKEDTPPAGKPASSGEPVSAAEKLYGKAE